jgi:putative membrane protein
MSLFSIDEERRVSEAITKAERTTSGEIVVVVAARSDSYLYVPPLVAALVSLLVPWVLIYFTRFDLQSIYLAQLSTFLVLTAVLMPMPVRVALVPPRIKRMHAHQRAVEQFLAQNMHTTADRTGVMLFVSVAERYVEILADTGIDACVPEGTWKGIVKNLTAAIAAGKAADGLVATVHAIGAHLERHFPPGRAHTNELPDHLIVLP